MNSSYNKFMESCAEISDINKEISRLKKNILDSKIHRDFLKDSLKKLDSEMHNSPFYNVESNQLRMALQMNSEYNRMHAQQTRYLKLALRNTQRLNMKLYNELSPDDKEKVRKRKLAKRRIE